MKFVGSVQLPEANDDDEDSAFNTDEILDQVDSSMDVVAKLGGASVGIFAAGHILN